LLQPTRGTVIDAMYVFRRLPDELTPLRVLTDDYEIIVGNDSQHRQLQPTSERAATSITALRGSVPVSTVNLG